ncbi:MAG TPA: ATP-binding cassette domain-containing protein, partial [Treponemataceae bacterium]|nr:ATP-binding cassette domain-containing protein [Treponemataceae bacterium]
MMNIRNLHKSFHRHEVIRGVDLSVHRGDVVVILGPSGAGKTTLLRTLNFLERADEGEMEFGQLKLRMPRATAKEIAEVRKRTGFVFQNYNLFNNKTA